jgi:hypothetical protein
VSPDAVGNNPKNTLAGVLSFCQNSLGVEVSPSDISTAHGLPKGSTDRHHPLVVRFANRRTRDKVYQARKSLCKPSISNVDPIFINEQLTKANGQLLAVCRKLWKASKIAGTWTWYGIVYAKLLPASGSQIVKILNDSDVAKLQ